MNSGMLFLKRLKVIIYRNCVKKKLPGKNGFFWVKKPSGCTTNVRMYKAPVYRVSESSGSFVHAIDYVIVSLGVQFIGLLDDQRFPFPSPFVAVDRHGEFIIFFQSNDLINECSALIGFLKSD